MATIFDPQNFSTDFLINSVNTYNNLTDENRSQYTDMTSFVPLQTDSANFSTTMKDPGFVKYMTAPIAEKAKGPTVTVQGGQSTAKTPSAEEILARMEAGQPMFYEGEDLPTYDPKSGMSPGQFWSQYPPLTYAGQGLKGTIYGLSDSQQKEVEEAPNVQATATPSDEGPLFQPGGHPGPSGYHSDISSASYPDFQSMVAAIERSIDTGFFGIPQMESYAQHYAAAKAQGKSDAQASNEAGTQIGIEAFSDPKSGLSHYGIYGGNTDGGGDGDGSSAAPTPTGAAAHGAQSAGMAGMAASAAAAAAASSAPGGAGHGEGHG